MWKNLADSLRKPLECLRSRSGVEGVNTDSPIPNYTDVEDLAFHDCLINSCLVRQPVVVDDEVGCRRCVGG